MTLPINGQLDQDNQESPGFEFTGEVSILIYGGSGTIQLQRSIKGSDYFPITDTAGNVAEYDADGGVVLNCQLENKNSSCKYRLAATLVDSPISYIVCR